jgi:S-adenosylmethionine uptake transporter
MSAPAAPARPSALLAPLAVAASAVLMYTAMDAMVKALPAHLSALQIVALRFSFGCVPAGLILWRAGARADAAAWRANGLRGVLVLLSTLLFFIALRRLAFAQTLALTFFAPLFMVLLAALLLGERLSLRMLGAIAVGLAGVAVILSGDLIAGTTADLPGIAAALASAVTYAGSMILLRRQAQRDRAEVIVLMQQLVPALLSLPLAAAGWTPFAPWLWLVFAALGTIGVAAHFTITWAYARAPAGRLAVMEYTALPWAALIGFTVFAEVPGWATMAGGALILAACLAASRIRR